MKNISAFPFAVVLTAMVSCLVGCGSPATTDTKTASVGAAMPVITNPRFTIAPDYYADSAEKALLHLGKFEFDAWAAMLADSVRFSFPDGDVDTRTVLIGKAAVVGWWKNWKQTSGGTSMTMSEFNHFPIEITSQLKAGAQPGMYVYSYLSNNLAYGDKSVRIRMNFVTRFDSNKKIDRYLSYYDRSPIIKLTGKNALETTQAQ